MFDCIRAIFTYLHGASLTLGLFWVSNFIKFLENLPLLRMESIVGAGLNISKSRIIEMSKMIAVDQ